MTWVSREGGDPETVGGTGGDAGQTDPGPPLLLATVFNPFEAEMIVAKLRSAGIDSFLRHEAVALVYGLTVDGMGQQDIMVRAEDLEEAMAALEETPLADSDDSADDEES